MTDKTDTQNHDKAPAVPSSEAQDSMAEIFFITIGEILAEYDGQLSAYIARNQARNMIVTMEVEMSVKGAKPRLHAAALAITHDYEDTEELMAMARQCFPKKRPFAFGWVPANLYGTDRFGIFIEQGDLGELLANGLIDDIIQTVGVEQAVTG